MGDSDSKDAATKPLIHVGEGANPHHEQGALDLGLGSLLKPQDQLQVPNDISMGQVDFNKAEAGPSNPESTEMKAPESSAFEKLADSQQWSSLLSETEAVLENQQIRLEASDSWIEAQAWWILAQLELKNLPSGVLSAPLESMLDPLIGSGTENSGSNPSKDLVGQHLESNVTLVKRASTKLAAKFFSLTDMRAGLQLLCRTKMLGGDLRDRKSVV